MKRFVFLKLIKMITYALKLYPVNFDKGCMFVCLNSILKNDFIKN